MLPMWMIRQAQVTFLNSRANQIGILVATGHVMCYAIPTHRELRGESDFNSRIAILQIL